MMTEQFWDAVRDVGSDDCWEWARGRTREGYGQLRLHGGHGMRRAHRVAWTLINGPIPPGMNVLHHCDNPPCCNVAHLFLGTSADNQRDCRAKGRGPIQRKGEANRLAKLTDADVAEIRALPRGWYTQRYLAARYGVDPSLISRIISGERRVKP